MYKKSLQARYRFTDSSLFSSLTTLIVKAKAIYAYTGSNPDELTFSESEELSIVDMSEDEWWKAEQRGAVYIVPAAYLEVVEG